MSADLHRSSRLPAFVPAEQDHRTPSHDEKALHEVYQRADAFLFGRRTYELFARYWGGREDLLNPIVGALNRRPKYVASNTLTGRPQYAT